MQIGLLPKPAFYKPRFGVIDCALWYPLFCSTYSAMAMVSPVESVEWRAQCLLYTGCNLVSRQQLQL
ncbi:hypothetical protein [Kosakonia sacchari]|uniref:hypothetical protein n=1 Tax=Kosakonia sacchari TaxID=1158459 RepID=UPI0003F1DC89|nr:hypothetical protein [Kosakonia sacchari]AHJ77464.1 hypothetical protein C813_00270 [Kosakonia sacchari SP1]